MIVDALTYDDVALCPGYSEIRSRKDPDTSTSLMGLALKTPIVSANMDTITESDMAIAMWKAGGVGVLHRFMEVERNCDEYEKVTSAGAECMISIGASGDWLHRAKSLYSVGARRFVIDIAHGHSILVKEVISEMRQHFGNDVKIMAGNVATEEALIDFKIWGADCVKVGVGGGSVCTTRLITGFGVPMFTSILECSEAARRHGLEIVADGGIRTSGDISKAVVAGANAVMVGKLLAGVAEAPGEISYSPVSGVGILIKKEYKGMSSVSTRQRIGSSALPEGIDTEVVAAGTVEQTIAELTSGLKSGMSYAGANNLSEMRKVRWMRQSHHGAIEGTPHVHR